MLAGNHTDGDIRAVGFVQRAAGRRVVGGQLSFRFKRDRLFMIGSEALPHVALSAPRARLAAPALSARAAAALRRDLALPTAPVSAPGDDVILPLVADDAVLGYRLATPIQIDGGADGRYLAYVDPSTGTPLAVQQLNRYATGTLRYLGVDRHPLRGRRALPAHRAHVAVGAVPQTTTSDGGLSWTPDAPQLVDTAVVGDLVAVANRGPTGARATTQLSLSPGGIALWDASANSEQDAQLAVYASANAAKEFVRANLDPAMPGLDKPLPANVNLSQTCNAFFDGRSINFMSAGATCQNTGLIEDVVYHEFGHALHLAEIVDGVGAFDGAMSEGAADFLTASITGDPGTARGFFYSDEPLRHLDPPGDEATWPEDIGEVHRTGLIYGGAMWDLRTSLIATLGTPSGLALTHRIYLATLRRATSIPTSLLEALATDDDDGDLANGTPHECLIRAAFGRHGLRTASAVAAQPGALDTPSPSTEVTVDLSGLSALCATDTIDRVDLIWLPGYTRLPAAGTSPMTALSPTRYAAPLPLPSDDVVSYSARVRFTDGTTLIAADNLADPYYSLYRGPTVPLYCTTFDDDPFVAGWTTGTSDNSPSPWAWGSPIAGGTDPPAAYSGTRILGQSLNGPYPKDLTTWVRLPDIDVGTWSDVHLQYRRWLATEDSFFDPARITVDGDQAWINASSNRGVASSLHHIDREWRFHDVRVSGFGFGHTLRLAFELKAEDELEFGGWSLDDVCVVANIHAICGDGLRTPTEQCDDGPANANTPNTCRTYCKLPACGDTIVDAPEACDDGPAGSPLCTPACESLAAPGDGGCCSSSSGSPAGSLLLALLAAIPLLRRRRRRQHLRTA